VSRAATAGFLAGWRILRLLPERTAQALFARVADAVHRRGGAGVRRLRDNLAVVRPDLDAPALDELTHAAVRSYLRYWCETFQMPSWPVDEVVSRLHPVREHLVRDAYAQGRGVVVPIPHMANWDWAGAWACGTGMPLMTVAERVRPERLYDAFVAHRARMGMQVLPLTGGEPVLPALVSWVRSGGLVCLLGDRDLTGAGLEVELCGHRVRMPGGPALLARRTGAPLVPVTPHYEGADMVLTFHPPVPHAPGRAGLVAMTQGIADAFSTALREHPQDWHMMQPFFADDPALRT
jgi:lauroyl/myristoyl acyltransferase